MKTLTLIKLLHTAIWLFFNVVMGYMLIAIINNEIDVYVWMGIGFVMIEGLVLLFFKNICPITLIARKYSGSHKDNFDIFLPNWLARNNQIIYTIIFIIIIILLAYRLITNYA